MKSENVIRVLELTLGIALVGVFFAFVFVLAAYRGTWFVDQVLAGPYFAFGFLWIALMGVIALNGPGIVQTLWKCCSGVLNRSR